MTLLIITLAFIIGFGLYMLIKTNVPTPEPIPEEKPEPVKPIITPIERWTDNVKRIKGLCIINDTYDDKPITLYVQYNNGMNCALDACSHTGTLIGSNSWNFVNGGFANIGWLEDIEDEGNYKISVYASKNHFNEVTEADHYEMFIGCGEGSDVTMVNDANLGLVNVIDTYAKNHLNGDGSNYYFYVRIEKFA